MSDIPSDPLIGTTIGNYEIKSLLGAGAMGQVFLGEHPHIGRKVAVKVLMASFSSNPEMADRFMSEAKAVNKINNPNIIQVFDFGKLPDGRLYLVMEFLEGVELSGYMESRGTVSIDETIELMGQIASALDAAHNAGIVHRDLKPDNIFVVDGPSGPVVKVLDFGVAKLLDPAMGGKHKTATGLIMGTPSYMSPEQARGSGAMIGPATDIYALGVIVYQMLSGHLPIDAESVTQVLLKHITDPPTPIFEFLPAFPPMLWEVIERALDKNIDARPPSASAFHHMFSEAARGIPSHITAVGMVSPIPARGTSPGLNSSAVKTSMTGEQIAVGGGRSAMMWVVILLVIAGIGGGVWWFGLRDKGEMKGGMKPAEPVAANNMVPADMPVADMPEEPMPPDPMPMEPVVEKKTFKLKVGSDKPGVEFKMKVDDEAELELRTPFEHTIVEGSRVLITPRSADYAQQSLTVTKDESLQLVSTAPAPMSVMGTSPMPPPMTAPMDVTPEVMKPMSVGEDTIKIMF
ncbi:MAG: hypothetical protein CVU59_09820 [Deltaproteobacteria bacterium HGW-Deltaproteobacteria-17]|nr:MAG: hypothetical protein CVU59_09820 [Deltaproteobacteria bacterium HGW-Deltaproteobacteria-17]